MSSPDMSLSPPENRGHVVIGMAVACIVIITVFGASRLYVRTVTVKQPGFDDLAMVFGWLFGIATSVNAIICTHYGLGQHVYYLTLANLKDYLLSFWTLIILYNCALTSVKIAFLLQYRRIFPTPVLQIICNILIVFVALFGLSQIFLTVFFCKPISGFWDVTLKAKCGNALTAWYVNAAMNVFTDTLIFVLPLPTLWTLQLPKNHKIALCGTFGLGFLVCVLSLVRVTTLRSAEFQKDHTMSNVASMCWTLAELSGGMICLCIPSLRHLVDRFVSRLFYSHPTEKSAENLQKASDGSGHSSHQGGSKAVKSDSADHLCPTSNLEMGALETEPSSIRN